MIWSAHNENRLDAIALRLRLILTCCFLMCLQWSFCQKYLYPSTLAGLFDVAPLLSLVPLISCYCFAVSAALQQPQKHQRRLLHGVKELRAQSVIFKRISAYYSQLGHRGPWRFDWAPPIAEVVRDWSASFIISVCLEQPEHLPEEGDIEMALARAESRQRTDPARWHELQVELRHAHAQIDAALCLKHIQELITVLDRVVAFMTPVRASSTKRSRLLHS